MARAGPRDMTLMPGWTGPHAAGRDPRRRVPLVRPVGKSQPAPTGPRTSRPRPHRYPVKPAHGLRYHALNGRADDTVTFTRYRRPQIDQISRTDLACENHCNQASASSKFFSPCSPTSLLEHPFPTHFSFLYVSVSRSLAIHPHCLLSFCVDVTLPTHHTLTAHGFLTGTGHSGQRHRHRPLRPASRSRPLTRTAWPDQHP